MCDYQSPFMLKSNEMKITMTTNINNVCTDTVFADGFGDSEKLNNLLELSNPACHIPINYHLKEYPVLLSSLDITKLMMNKGCVPGEIHGLLSVIKYIELIKDSIYNAGIVALGSPGKEFVNIQRDDDRGSAAMLWIEGGKIKITTAEHKRGWAPPGYFFLEYEL